MTENPTPESQNKASLGIVIFGLITALVAFAVFAVVILSRAGSPTQENGSNDPNAAAIVDPAQQSTGVSEVEPRALSDIKLTASNGESLSLTDFDGKYVVLYFGYTYCPDFCPTTLTDFRLTKRELGTDAENIQFVMVSVDPERDTPQILADYMQRFDPTFIGLTGDIETLRQVSDEFGAFFQIAEDVGTDRYRVDHTATKFLIDPEGRWVAQYAYGTPIDVMVTDLKARIGQS